MINGRSTDVHILFSDTEAMRQHGLSISGLGSAAFGFRAELDEFGFGLVDIFATQATARAIYRFFTDGKSWYPRATNLPVRNTWAGQSKIIRCSPVPREEGGLIQIVLKIYINGPNVLGVLGVLDIS